VAGIQSSDDWTDGSIDPHSITQIHGDFAMKSVLHTLALGCLIGLGSFVFSGCGSSSDTPDKMNGGMMADEKMSGEAMSGDKMSDDKMGSGKMSDEKMN
jgi:pentapeptide MXKDX repeat protein